MPLSLINPLTEASTIATSVVNNSAQTNYIAFPVATSDPTSNGWTVYKDTDTVLPVDGTGGSPVITLTRNTDTPLSSTGDFRLTKSSGASRRGEGISTDFIISPRHLSKVLQISFDYEVISGSSLATDDLRVYIIQGPGVTNTAVEPVNVSIQGSVSGIRVRHLATFQTDISVTSYRLCIHVSTTTNSTQIIDFNNFRVWESVQSISSVITDWISYTPSTTRANTTNRSFYYRRSGGNIQISFGWQYTSGVSGSSTALLSDIFPPGLTLDLTRIAPANGSGAYLRYTIGHYFVNDFGVNNYIGAIVWDTNQDPDQIAFMGIAPNGTDDNLSGMIECPIQGWGSSVAMSSDSGDGRVVAVKYTNTNSTSINPIRWGTREIDTHNAYNSSTGVFTVPVSGIYRVSISYQNDTANAIVTLRKNGSNNVNLVQNLPSGSNFRIAGSAIIQANAGDTLDVIADSGSTNATSNLTHISIERISAGSQIISTTETVVAVATKESGSWSDNTIVTWSNKQVDSHGALNISTGEFTCPMNGKYLITANLHPNGYFTGSGTNTYSGVQIRKNATLIARSQNYWNGSGSILVLGMNCTHIVDCIAGDKLSIYGAGTWTVETGKFSHLSIMRIGI